MGTTIKDNEYGYEVLIIKYDKETKKSEKFTFQRVNNDFKNNKSCYQDAINIICSLRDTVEELSWLWNIEYEIYTYATEMRRCSKEMNFSSETEKYSVKCKVKCYT